METTIEEMIDQLNQRMNAEHTTLDNRLSAMRRDFETEATKVKNKLVKLGEAVAILAHEASLTTKISTLSVKGYKRITELLNT